MTRIVEHARYRRHQAARVAARGWSRLRYRWWRFGAWDRGALLMRGARVHPASAIHLGAGVHIAHGAFLGTGSEHAVIRIGAGSRFGEGLFIQSSGLVEIGPHVLGSQRVFISDTSHRFDDASRPIIDQPMAEPRPVHIGRGAFLGVGCCVMPGVSIGENAVIGANAVVTADVPPHTVVAGVPARVIRSLV